MAGWPAWKLRLGDRPTPAQDRAECIPTSPSPRIRGHATHRELLVLGLCGVALSDAQESLGCHGLSHHEQGQHPSSGRSPADGGGGLLSMHRHNTFPDCCARCVSVRRGRGWGWGDTASRCGAPCFSCGIAPHRACSPWNGGYDPCARHLCHFKIHRGAMCRRSVGQWLP